MSKELRIAPPSWAKRTLYAASVLALAIAAYWIWEKIERTPAPGCFTFTDGTTQGWTLDQLYDVAKPNTAIATAIPAPPGYQTYTPFTLTNYAKQGISAHAPIYLLTDNKIKNTQMFLDSSDVSNDTLWQNVKGYSVDITRQFTGACGDLNPNDYQVQLQARLVLKSTNSEHLISDFDSTTGKAVFHVIAYDKKTPLELAWSPTLTLDGKTVTPKDFTIKQLRIRIINPGYLAKGECAYKGRWMAAKVCPKT